MGWNIKHLAKLLPTFIAEQVLPVSRLQKQAPLVSVMVKSIPLMAFGLKNDFRNELFEGSKYLLLYADKIEEMKTICWFCHKKAIMNLHYIDGNPVYEGDQVQIVENESY